MSWIEIFRAIFINIRENKVKVFLTSLGIIVGSLTIVMVIAIGKGGQAEVEEQFKSLSVGSITIMNNRGDTTETLSLSDLEAIKEGAPSLSEAGIMISGRSNASYYDTTCTDASVAGVTQEYKELTNLELEYGEFITNYHDEKRQKVAIVGSDIADELFGDEKGEAIGKEITIKGKKYEVIGVSKRVGESSQGFDIDGGILLPYQVAEKYVLGSNLKPKIIAVAKDIDYVSSAMEEITEILKKTYKDNINDFLLRDAGSKLEAAQNSAKTMSVLLISVAMIVLIVGGIGIMNVLLVSVKERTKEIGILKAIGARKKDILFQFLLEAIVISGSGGFVGILLSVLAMPLMKYFDLRVISSLYGYVMALVFSVGTGTFFGYYPASKAANLKPIDALNYE